MTINKLIISIISILFILFIYQSCSQEKTREKSINQQQLKESLVKVNKLLVLQENEKIKAFIDRYGWKMQLTNSGLYYNIYRHTEGIKAVMGDTVVLKYECMLLNGEKMYSSQLTGPLLIETGKNKTVRGLEEGIFLLRLGERAKFIVPSHLAFGLLGDENKIPQKATLVYDVELSAIKKNH